MTRECHGNYDLEEDKILYQIMITTSVSPQSKTVNEWVNQGVSRDKLLLGFASYGLSTRLSDPTLHNIGDSYTRLPGTPGRLTATSGFLAYYEVRSFPLD